MEELFDIFTLPERPRTMVDNQEGEEDGAVVVDVRDEVDERFMTNDYREKKKKKETNYKFVPISITNCMRAFSRVLEISFISFLQ